MHLPMDSMLLLSKFPYKYSLRIPKCGGPYWPVGTAGRFGFVTCVVLSSFTLPEVATVEQIVGPSPML